MMLPTRRAVVLLAALAPLALAGYATPWALDLVLAADALLIALIAIDARLAVRPERLELRREAPAALSVGRPGEERTVWHNPTGRKARLVVRETWPAVLGGVQPARTVTVTAKGRLVETLPVTPARRGIEASGWLALRSIGPLGLGQHQARRELPWQVSVFPALPASLLRASIAQAMRSQAGYHAMRRRGEGGRQFEGLREGVPGDDTRSIDWKATARRRKVIVREYEDERRQQVMLVLDAGRLMTASVDGTPLIEFAVRAALDLACAAVHHDDNVGIMVFDDRIRFYSAPQRGQRGLREVLRALATVEPGFVEPDYPAAFRHLAIQGRKRAFTVFIGDVIDRGASEAMITALGSLRPRHLPLAVTLRSTELEAAATRRPADAAQAWQRAAAESLIEAREGAIAVMRRAGVMVIDVAPARAGAAAVNAYLELKRRGRI